jgi:hypothetical protein
MIDLNDIVLPIALIWICAMCIVKIAERLKEKLINKNSTKTTHKEHK